MQDLHWAFRDACLERLFWDRDRLRMPGVRRLARTLCQWVLGALVGAGDGSVMQLFWKLIQLLTLRLACTWVSLATSLTSSSSLSCNRPSGSSLSSMSRALSASMYSCVLHHPPYTSVPVP